MDGSMENCLPPPLPRVTARKQRHNKRKEKVQYYFKLIIEYRILNKCEY
jgi:hypothetical protein